MHRRLAWLVIVYFALPLLAQKYEVRIDFNQRVKMRDAVELSADVYRPDAPGKFPVILSRTPYTKTNSLTMAAILCHTATYSSLWMCVGAGTPTALETMLQVRGFLTQLWYLTRPTLEIVIPLDLPSVYSQTIQESFRTA